MADATEFHDRMLSLGLARVSEAAALASAGWIGRGDEKAADQAAVNAMRDQLNLLDIAGVVVIGEGERDEAPMLYIGEQVGSGTGPAVDIALDPLEGTTLTAKDMPNALTVIAMAPRGTLLHAPDVYMDKLAIGPGYPPDTVTLAMTPVERVQALARARGCAPADITVCVLERPRHEDLIRDVRSTGAAIRLITDGDVAGVIHCAEAEKTGIDMYMGTGGAPEGVLADLNRVYTLHDLVTADVIFAATGVTQGSILNGIRREPGWVTLETILMRSKTGSVRRIEYRSPVK